jgi:GxxExxY protein
VPELLYKDEVYAIVGAAMEVYNTLGPGFLEAVYQEAFEIEMTERGIPFESQQELLIFYKGRQLHKAYLADIIASGKIIVELKALGCLSSHEEAQLLNYLKATGLELGVLINFGAAGKLEWKRMIKSSASNANRLKTN